ncbi:MAG: response regulator [Pseudomonadales bacterium]
MAEIMDECRDRLSVLVADDHRLVAEALTSILEEEFHLVGIVGDGSALLDAAATHQPDVIVSDISMPGLNGIEALSALKDVAPNARVVILTMHRTPAYARQALEAGASAYVVKHAASTELLDAVRAAGRGETWVPASIRELLTSAETQNGPLSARQREILELLAEGLSAKEIAVRLNISPRTVEFHKYGMMDSLGISSTAELVRYALRTGIAEY